MKFKDIREAEKKVLLLMTGLLRPNLPPLPQELNGRWKKGFSLIARPFTPPPLNGPAIKIRTFLLRLP